VLARLRLKPINDNNNEHAYAGSFAWNQITRIMMIDMLMPVPSPETK
jgi:hypothetical protein